MTVQTHEQKLHGILENLRNDIINNGGDGLKFYLHLRYPDCDAILTEEGTQLFMSEEFNE